jgi:hypothetical protein
MEQTECSETSAYKIQTPGDYPEEKTYKYFFFENGDVYQKNTKNKPQTDRPRMTENNMVHAG